MKHNSYKQIIREELLKEYHRQMIEEGTTLNQFTGALGGAIGGLAGGVKKGWNEKPYFGKGWKGSIGNGLAKAAASTTYGIKNLIKGAFDGSDRAEASLQGDGALGGVKSFWNKMQDNCENASYRDENEKHFLDKVKDSFNRKKIFDKVKDSFNRKKKTQDTNEPDIAYKCYDDKFNQYNQQQDYDYDDPLDFSNDGYDDDDFTNYDPRDDYDKDDEESQKKFQAWMKRQTVANMNKKK